MADLYNFVDINGNDIEENLHATADTHGLMCPSDKIKLASIEEGANKTIVDSVLSISSVNPVQNKIITNAINETKTYTDNKIKNHTHKPSNIIIDEALDYIPATDLQQYLVKMGGILNGKASNSHTHDYLPLSGGSLTGNLSGLYITGTWLQSTSSSAVNSTNRICCFDASGWIYYITPDNLLSGYPTKEYVDNLMTVDTTFAI